MDADAWALRLPNYQSAYESEYVPQVLSALSNQGGVSSPHSEWRADVAAHARACFGLQSVKPTLRQCPMYLETQPAIDAALHRQQDLSCGGRKGACSRFQPPP